MTELLRQDQARVEEDNAAAPPLASDKIDKSQLANAEPKRLRDKAHLKFVASQPCLVCGRQPSDPHHLRFAQPPALGRKVSDEFTVPVCRLHHREIHRQGDEAAWWKKAGIEPLSAALTLWRQTHPLGATADRRIGEDAIGASPTEYPPRAGEVQRGEIDKTNPFPEIG